jgi:hypothetical protein
MFKLLQICLLSFGIFLGNPTFDPFISSIQTNQISELSTHFDEEISLTLGKQKGYYPREKAEQAIQHFLKQHPVQKAYIQSTGTKNNDQFAIGKLVDKSGKTFRLFMMGQEKNRRFVLLELRFQE